VNLSPSATAQEPRSRLLDAYSLPYSADRNPRMNTLASTVQLHLFRFAYRVSRDLRASSSHQTLIDMASYTAQYKKIWRTAVRAIGADFSELSPGVWKVRYGGRTTLINNYKVQIDDPVTLSIAGNKGMGYRLLTDARITVPKHRLFTTSKSELALEFMTNAPKGLFVVKPAVGTSAARGISTHIMTKRECVQAIALASLYGNDLIIETFIPGESYRLLILDGEMIHAARRQGLRFIGDGKTSVGSFIESQYLSAKNSFLPKIFRRDYQFTLTAQGLGLASVPAPGQEVIIGSSSRLPKTHTSVHTVFDEDVTQMICNELKEEAVKVAGVDLISLDPSKSLSDSGGAINEINTTPGLHHHYNLRNQGDPSPAVMVVRYLLGTSDSR
jgi:D-alanine-D-alanine ligase-like ATP-grasp enzyme